MVFYKLFSVDPGQQVQQVVKVVCNDVFTENPVLRLNFLLSDNTPRRVQVRLPVTVSKFVDPVEFLPVDFFKLWRDNGYQSNEECQVADIDRKFKGAGGQLQLAKAVCLGDVLKLCPGIDSNPDNLILCGRIRNERSHHLLLARVEIGSGVFKGKVRIACRSSSGALAKSVAASLMGVVGPTANEEAQ